MKSQSVLVVVLNVLVDVVGVLVGIVLFWDGLLGVFSSFLLEREHLVYWTMYLEISSHKYEDLCLYSLNQIG